MRPLFLGILLFSVSCKPSQQNDAQTRDGDEAAQIVAQAALEGAENALKAGANKAAMATNDCYDPYYEEIFNKMYPDRTGYDSIFKVAHKKYNLDPRIIMFPMLGESAGDPDLYNLTGSGAYGIFQFLGGFYLKPPHKEIIMGMYPKNSTRTQRQYTQLRYYGEVYVAGLVDGMKYQAKTSKCGPVLNDSMEIWNQMSNMNRSMQLGWGMCTPHFVNEHLKLINGINQSYVHAGKMIRTLEGFPGKEKKLPLCENWSIKED